MDVVAPLAANGQPAVLAEPSQSALHYPAMSPQSFPALNPLARSPALAATPTEYCLALLVIVRLVRMQLPRPQSGRPQGRLTGLIASTNSANTSESWLLAPMSTNASGMP